MDKNALKQEILDAVSQMIDDAITAHTHNGADSQQITGYSIANAPQPLIQAPTGGATVDTQSRQAINDIRSLLIALGFMNNV